MTTQSKPTRGGSVLAALTAATVEASEAKQRAGARTLTPVAGEQSQVPRTSAPFPNDQPAEVIEHVIIEIERQAQYLLDAAAALRTLIAKPAGSVEEQTKAIEKEAEKIADAKAAAAATEKPSGARHNTRAAALAALKAEQKDEEESTRVIERDPDAPVEDLTQRMARLTAEAQEATFTPDVKKAETVKNGWTCADHGRSGIEQRISPRRGVAFWTCQVADCRNFEHV